MTLSEAKKLYIDAGGPPNRLDSEWIEIHREIEAVVAAKTDRAAGKTIQWWGCWDWHRTATAFARQVREAHKL